MSGTGDEMKGRAKKAVGDLTGDEKLRDEGKTDQAAGSIKGKVDEAKRWVQDKLGRRES